MAKFIFITGGVVSGLGKGITGSSLGVLLKKSGLKVFMQKFDPYLNIDPGTMNPREHGEVFVTADGGETDLDLGHYERFIDVDLSKDSSLSSGKIYNQALDTERSGGYGGKTVQIIPHITNIIKEKVYQAEKNSGADVIITEIGGTVGDIESQPFIEALRQVKMERGANDVMFIHVALLPFLKVSNEYKTKPIQHSVKEMLGLGIQPDVIVARTENEIGDQFKEKISLFCNIPLENVINCADASTIYKVPLILEQQKLHLVAKKHLGLKMGETNIDDWIKFNKDIENSKEEIKVHIVGKYVELPDAYLSVMESLRIAGYDLNRKVKFEWIDAKKLNEDNYKDTLNGAVGILVPGGFGETGVLGKVLAARFARENNIPYLGLCLGMQVACIEFARDVLGWKDANTTEIDEKTTHPIIDIIEGKNREHIGGTLRLGKYTAELKSGSLAEKLYGSKEAVERHRHRYEFNDKFMKDFEEAGMVFSGLEKNSGLVEIVEIPSHKFFIASQYHPEFTSRPNKPNPLFRGFVEAIIK